MTSAFNPIAPVRGQYGFSSQGFVSNQFIAVDSGISDSADGNVPHVVYLATVLTVATFSNLTASPNQTFTVYRNGVATSTTFTVTTQRGVVQLANPLSVSVGDRIGVFASNAGGGNRTRDLHIKLLGIV